MRYGCPNPQCKFYKKMNSIVRCGSYFRKNDSRYIPRYRCNCCRRHFSTATFSLAKNQKKRRVNIPLERLLCSGVSMRRVALILNIHRITVKRKLLYLAKKARVDHNIFLHGLRKDKVEHMQFDDLITIEHTKLKPLTISTAVDAQRRYILGAEVGSIPAFGHLAELSRRKYGYRKSEHRNTLETLFDKIKCAITPHAKIESDEHTLYPQFVRKYFKDSNYKRHKGGRGAVVGQGELKKLYFDPLFQLNHTCAMFRANINRLIRKTWCTTKDPEMLQNHIDIYINFHNAYIAPKIVRG